MAYEMTWITPQLSVGYAPMSYAELDFIREQGISAIVNLCGEFCDLHEIEEKSGFEVYYLPVPDECAPDMAAMEQALEWLDEALYLKKKILVHCRHGHGRTGTFVSAYLLRRGLGLKRAGKTLKQTRANPTNYSQWKMLRQYGKEQGQLALREATIEDRQTIDLLPFLQEYSGLLAEAEGLRDPGGIGMPLDTRRCCHSYFDLGLIEAVFVSFTINRNLKRVRRTELVERALAWATEMKELRQEYGQEHWRAVEELTSRPGYACPLLVDDACQIHDNRPLRCRCLDDQNQNRRLSELASEISRNVFLILTGEFPPSGPLRFSLFDTISGRFVQQYFQAMVGRGGEDVSQ
ncbi:MAG: dual specificity protein phosphatase family protein [Desulfobulbaceae bacterium]|uniref:Dual specificity protein phosphatase family protein n=1 Tax=Candidatus Desulfatifera sulfidica TaxID=2841691 RepID=A0A8J6TD20_9BACT|nr:dual specificity protein phosphatase family protein [Candidatus Desulfatifera sulfidica]